MTRSLFCALKRFVICGTTVLLSACGGGGGGDSSATQSAGVIAEEEGQLIVGLTDAPGDFLRYLVTVDSVLLEKADGTTVETLPLSTRVDFSELTEVTEFLTVATVPAGTYRSVVIHLDFTDAEVVVQDAGGGPQRAAVVDVGGDPLGAYAVRLQLTTSDVIRIAPGIPAAFSLDFDLDASNEIAFTDTGAVVTVEPFLLAAPELETGRAHRVRGVLADVDPNGAEVTLKVRPFHHFDGDFGRFTFAVDEATEYEIDGVSFTGGEGLSALADLPENTPVVGGIHTADAGFLAHTVLAGTSVPWASARVVKGIVTAREGDALTVRGALVRFGESAEAFRGTHTVLVGVDTVVSALGAPSGSLNAQSISVGQRIVAFGEPVDDATFDASRGRVRMLVNQLTARVLQPDPMIVDLYYLNGRRPAVFDFSGTGMTADQDADVDRYEIDTSVLGLNSITTSDLVRVRGLVNAFGMAAPDFNARTVIDVQTDMRGASLKVGWEGGSDTPFAAIAPQRIDLSLVGARAVLKLTGVPLALTNPLETLALLAPPEGRGAYAVLVRGEDEAHVYREFADLVEEINEQLNSGNRLHRIGAHGRYNSDTHEMTAGRASFVFNGPMPTDS